MDNVTPYCIHVISSRYTLLLFFITNSTLNLFMKINLGIMYTSYFKVCLSVMHFVFEICKKTRLYTKMLLPSELTTYFLEVNEVNGQVPTTTATNHAGDHISPRKDFQNIGNT